MADYNAIPAFNERGCLPEDVYPCDFAVFRHYFVDNFVERFGEHTNRATIFEGFERLREETASQGLIATQWVDGSFVEESPAPEDVDVVSFCDYDFLNSLPPALKDLTENMLNGRERTEVSHNTHSFLVTSCAQGHPYYPVFEKYRSYWRNWFFTQAVEPPTGPPRIVTGAKGIIQLSLGDANTVPTIGSERSAP